MNHIPLSRGLFAVVDDEDYERLACFKWHASAQPGGLFRAARDAPRPHRHKILMAREILGVSQDAVVVDHRNGDPLDNRRENLRVATVTENVRNSAGWGRRSAPYKGIAMVKRDCRLARPWVAKICVNRRRIHLGYFATPEEAAAAYNRAATEHFGEFARVNEVAA